MLEDSRDRVLDIYRDRMSALLTMEPFTGDHFGLCSRSEPMAIFVRTSGQQAWPPRLPVVRQEDLLEMLSSSEADLLRLVWHLMAQPSPDEGVPAMLQRLLTSSSPAASSAAAFLKLQSEWPSAGSGAVVSDEGATPSDPIFPSQDLLTRANEFLLTPPQFQISAHRQWVRDQLITNALRANHPEEAGRLFQAALGELVGMGFSEEPLAVAWLYELSDRFPQTSPVRAQTEQLVLLLHVSRERVTAFNDRRASSTSGSNAVPSNHLEVEWAGRNSEILGVRLVLPPPEPTLNASLGPWTDRIQVRASHAVSTERSLSLAPLFPEHALTVRQVDETTIPWRSYWTTGLLGVGVLLASVGVMAAVRGVSSKERALEEKSELLTALSHQLKTPAANVRLFTETLCRKDIPPEDRERMQQILHEESLRLQDVLDRVLAYQAASEPDLRRREAVLLRPLFEQRAARWQLSAQLKRAHLQLELCEGVEAAADPDALLDAMDNLVDNAFGAIDAGGRVTVGYAAESNMVTFYVEDDGHGISDKDAPNVFQRFYRGQTRRSRAGGGSGLGLAIVASVAHRHGGEARIARTGPDGTRMEMRIPGGESRGTPTSA